MDNAVKLHETLQEAVVYFSDVERAHEFFVQVRWPNGVSCPPCGVFGPRRMVVNQKSKAKGKEGQIIKRHVWQCNACREQFTAKTGTIFEDSPLGLDKWLIAMWMITNCKNGVSSHEMERTLGVSQKSTWFMLHRIREAMKAGTILKMTGTVESDETFIGGLEKNKHKDKKLRQGRGTVGKAIVQGVIERGTNGRKSRVAANVIKGTDAAYLENQVSKYVEVGTYVYTDAHKGYRGLSNEFVHDFIDHAVTYANGVVHTNGMENFWSLLKRGLKGTYIAVRPFHLERYVDEQAFRFNERANDDGDGGRFLKVLTQASGRRLTWDELTASDDEFYASAW